MARADRRQAARQARRVERRPSAASGASRPCRRHDVLPEAPRARALGLRAARDRLRRRLRPARRRLGDVGPRGHPQGNFGDLFGSNTGASAQAKKDQDRIKKNPKDYAAYKDLASALAADGKTDEAIATLQQLKAVNPKDVDGLTQLASLYLSKADQAQTEGQAIQAVVGEPDQPDRLRARVDDEARQGVPGPQRPHRHRDPRPT